jgi:hypothetical protein
MLEGKKVKLAFHAMVANYCGNLDVSSIISMPPFILQ